MESKALKFFDGIKGKKIAFCGIGRSNLPLVDLFAKYGAKITVCDRQEKATFANIAEELEQKGAVLKCGEDYLTDLDADIIFRTPGMYFNMPQLLRYREKGVVVTSEMEVFFDLVPCKTIGITGSDGKTTTTSIIAKLLEQAGKNVILGGNIGRPLLPVIETITPKDYVVAELSSFQLISMRRSPDIAVWTNMSPNHLDVHRDMEEYIEAKQNILLHQNAFSKTVLNLDNEITRSMAVQVRGELNTFSREKVVENGVFCEKNGEIFKKSGEEIELIMNSADIFIKGEHNIENYLAAICAVSDFVEIEDIVKVAKNFSGVEHRMEFVRELDGVKYYNDSIATSPTRTIAGLKAFDEKILLIAGGYDKNISYEPLGSYVNRYVKTLILMGGTAEKIETAVKAHSDYSGALKIVRVSSMEEAVAAAMKNVENGDIVSLSPASAAFDMYKDFEERGRHFKKIVRDFDE